MVTAMAKVIEYYERKMDFDRAARNVILFPAPEKKSA
jgi:hypothetical protein